MAVFIPIGHLLWMLLPTGAALGLIALQGLALRPYLWAIARMTVQPLLIGYVLVFLFGNQTSWVPLVVLGFMALAGAWIGLRTVARHRQRLYMHAFLALGVSGGFVLAVVTQAILRITPWYAPQTLIPLGGMVFANGMNGISLAAERLWSELQKGASLEQARRAALTAALIPITNALMAVGLVSLPGLMTGQILAGVAPQIAVRYQIVIMLMVFSVIGLATSGFLYLSTPFWKEQLASLSATPPSAQSSKKDPVH